MPRHDARNHEHSWTPGALLFGLFWEDLLQSGWSAAWPISEWVDGYLDDYERLP